nr:hypothetical protein [Pseudomonas fulva]
MKAWIRRRPGAAILFIVAVFCLGLIVLVAVLNRASCAWYGYQTERDTRYAAFVGCMVKMPSGWVPRAEIRIAQ